MIVKNREELVSHGNRAGRAAALDILEAGLAAADPYAGTRALVRLEGNRLFVGGHPEMDVSGLGDEVVDLRDVDHVYVVGAGKAVQRQAKALEDVLGDRLTAGAVTVKEGEGKYLERIEVTEAAHPVPDASSAAGAERIVEIAGRATERDLVFTIFSDGSSSLFALPADGYTVDDLRALYRLAIKYGNQTVITRPMVYFSRVNCGRIVKLIHPARMINLITCTVPYRRWRGQLPSSRIFVPSWPPGPRRLAQAAAEFRSEPWYDELPGAMRAALERRDPGCEVPDLDDFRRMRLSYWQPVDSQQMVMAAKRKAEELGFRGAILGLWSLASCGGVAHVLAGIARQVALHGQPFEPPVALISTGELTVPVGSATGIGGRNQEFVLDVALHLRGLARPGSQEALQTGVPVDERMVVASADSDGTDGPGAQLGQDAPEGYPCQAGGVADGETLDRAKALGIDIAEEIRNHNSGLALWRLGDSIYTGNTGACVGDLRVILVPEQLGEA